MKTICRVLAVLAVWGMGMIDLSAHPYASGVTNQPGNLSFVLNEMPTAVVITWDGGAASTNLASFAVGTNTVSLNGHTNFSIAVYNSGSGALSQISSDTTSQNDFYGPRGVAVNKNPKTGNFGRIYVANANGGSTDISGTFRTTSRGIYVMDAASEDFLGQGMAAATAGMTLGTSTAYSPYKLFVGPDDMLYVGDCGTTNISGIWMVDPNLSSSTALFPTANPSTNTATVSGNFGRVIGTPFVTGSYAAGTLSLSVIMWDLNLANPPGTYVSGPTSAYNQLYQYNIGGRSLPWTNFPTVISNPIAIGNINTVVLDSFIAPDGKYFICADRFSPTDNTTNVCVLDNTGTTVLWDSKSASASYFNDSSRDHWDMADNGITVSPDDTLVAVSGATNNEFLLMSLTNGIPDPSTLFTNTTVGANGGTTSRSIVFDMADNIYITSGGSDTLRIYSLGYSTVAVTTNDLTGTNGAFNIAGISGLSPSLVMAPGATASFTVTNLGASASYRWYHGASQLVIGPTGTGSAIAGSSTSSLSISNISTSDVGSYTVVVTSGSASITSSVVTLSVLSAPTITSQPVNQTNNAGGETATFTVAVSGPGPFTYQWQLNGTNIPNNIITTVAGNGSSDYSGDGGVATNAGLGAVGGLSFDSSGNLFIAAFGNQRIRKVSPNGIITTPPGGYLGYQPQDVIVDASGNLYISDVYGGYIFKLNTNGIATRVAGGGNGDDGGQATNAILNYPEGEVFDTAGNLYFGDIYNQRVRKVGTNGIITSVAGNSGFGYTGDGGPATSATMRYPSAEAFDAPGNLYIADYGNNAVRKVDTNGIITTFAGGGASLGDGGPATNASLSLPDQLTCDAAGILYIADLNDNRIRKVDINGIITTVAGNGSRSYSGDGGPATNASLNQPDGVALDPAGNLFIGDNNNVIRMVTFANQPTLELRNVTDNNAGSYTVIVSNAYGSVTSSVATLTVTDPTIAIQPHDTTVNYGATATFTVIPSGAGPFTYQWQLNGTNIPNNIITTVAGNGGSGYSGDGGAATNAGLNPSSVAFDASGNLYIADDDNNRVRKVSTNGIITTVAGNGATNYSGDGGAAANASLDGPQGVAFDISGNLFIADQQNNRIRKVSTNGIITTVAGNGITSYSGDGGAATNASLDGPQGVAFDISGNLFIADAFNQRIREVSTNGIITTVAGNGGQGYSGDGGAATNARFNNPGFVALDASGNLFISDWDNWRLRKVGTNGIINTVAGDGGYTYSGDGGAATSANLFTAGAAFDASGNIFIADTGNQRIRQVSTNGIITTVAGNGTASYSGDGGAATNATLDSPFDVAFDASGNIFIVDTGNERIREVTSVNQPTLELRNVTDNNAGSYTVVVTDPYGSVTSSVARLDVTDPAIVIQPVNLTGECGSNVVFSVTATGTAPLTYQWYILSAPLTDGPGVSGSASASLTLNNLSLLQSDKNYSVVVSNANGNSVTSSVATLTVQDTIPPVVSLHGMATTNVECHTSFTDPGATANDLCAGITAVTTNGVGTVNANVIGTYHITYSSTDPSTNTGAAVRTVNVVDTTPPVVTLIGPSTISIEVRTAFSDPGATANDSCAGSVPYLPLSNYNTNAAGTYLITYSATDPSLNTGATIRTLIVTNCPNTNSWTSLSSGKWEVGTNWSVGVPALLDTTYITNTGAKTVTIDATTTGSFPYAMAISNLIIGSADDSGTNTLFLNNAGTNVPLTVLSNFWLQSGGALIISNSAFDTSGLGTNLLVDGSILMEGGIVNLNNTFLGNVTNNATNGSIVLNGGTLSMPELHIGYQSTSIVSVAGGVLSNTLVALAENAGANGTLNITGGTNYISGMLHAGTNGLSTGAISVTGGALLVTNATGTAVTLLDGAFLYRGSGLFKSDNILLTNGGSIVMLSNFDIGATAGTTNTAQINDGALIVTNSTFGIGNDGSLTNGSGTGVATISNSTVTANTINIGSSAGGSGTMTLQSNAEVTVNSNISVVSGSLGATNSIVLDGGSLTATNGTVQVGPTGSGQMLISGGAHTIRQMLLGSTNEEGSGFLMLSGGSLKILDRLDSNFVIVNGGDLDGSGASYNIANGHNSTANQTSGTGKWGSINVGYSPGFTGVYNQSGGMLIVYTNMIVGDCINGAVGQVNLTGGTLYITNATHTAVLNVSSGNFIMSTGSTLVVDTIIVTNSCAHFIKAGGTLVQNNPPVLDPNLDADSDGMPNWAEARAGTDPLDPNSNLEITSITPANTSDILIQWMAEGGHSYVVQTNGDLLNGTFRDMTGDISVGGTTATTASYLHTGAGSKANLYYRIRLGP